MEVKTKLAVTRKEAAEMLSVSERTIAREIARGNITAFQIGSVWRIRLVEIDGYLRRLEEKSGTGPG